LATNRNGGMLRLNASRRDDDSLQPIQPRMKNFAHFWLFR